MIPLYEECGGYTFYYLEMEDADSELAIETADDKYTPSRVFPWEDVAAWTESRGQAYIRERSRKCGKTASYICNVRKTVFTPLPLCLRKNIECVNLQAAVVSSKRLT